MVLVLRALGLGDFLAGLPALRGVREAFPGQALVLAASPRLGALALWSGAADHVLPSNGLRPVAVAPPEVAINLHGKGPQSHRLLLRTGARRYLWYENAQVPESLGGPRWQEEEHEVLRWCRMLREHRVGADPSQLDLAPPPLPGRFSDLAGATLIHPGASTAARRWPPDRWAAVARSEAALGRQVVHTGGSDEVELAHRVADPGGVPRERVLAGSLDVLELAGVVAGAGRVLSADTGVAHLATALRRPSVVLFGPTPPTLWGPPVERDWHRALWAGLTGEPRGEEPHPGLLAITVDEVLAAIAELPPGRSSNLADSLG
jgi:ADP-heptose:LPS heptosyltransferase